jgi:DNA-binding response OmpR family regulator
VRILVVEDEPALQSYLVPLLHRNGYDADAVGTGAEALAAVEDRTPDLVLLDIGLPDLSGLDVCRELRRRPQHLPIVLLTGLDGRDDELRGFEAKADDYVSKPVVPETLVARIRAVLRLAAASHGGHLLTLGDVDIDLRLRDAMRDGRSLGLTPKEFDLLAFLLEHPGQVFGKTQLIAQVWGPDFQGDPHTVESRMSRIRLAVEANPNRPVHLHNRRGVGYYLTLEPRSSS